MNNGKYKTKTKNNKIKGFLNYIVVNKTLALIILLVLIPFEVANGIFTGNLFSILVASALLIPLTTIYVKIK
jgi:hypothetical protein